MEVMIDWSQLLPLVLLTWNETQTFFDSPSYFFCFEFEEMSKMKKKRLGNNEKGILIII